MFDIDADALEEAKAEFASTRGKPFNHAVVSGLIAPEVARACAEEFKDVSVEKFLRYSDPDFEFQKLALNKAEQMPSKLRQLFDYLHSAEGLALVEGISGIKGLKVDEGRWGGGLHMTLPEGYLAVHRDFSVLPTSYRWPKQYLRTINVIGYLTPEWQPGWGGELELWDDSGTSCVNKIAPEFNTWVIFDTRRTYHGHPYPYRGQKPRLSVAAYYYQEIEVPVNEWTSTDYLRLPWREDTPEYAMKRRLRADATKRYSELLK